MDNGQFGGRKRQGNRDRDGQQRAVVLRNFEFRPSDLTGLFENFDWLIIRALFFIVDLRLCVTRYEGRFTSIIIIFT